MVIWDKHLNALNAYELYSPINKLVLSLNYIEGRVMALCLDPNVRSVN